MKLDYLYMVIDCPWSGMLSKINRALSERGVDASAIISIDVDRRPTLGQDAITVFYRQPEPSEYRKIAAKHLRVGDTFYRDNEPYTISAVELTRNTVKVDCEDLTAWNIPRASKVKIKSREDQTVVISADHLQSGDYVVTEHGREFRVRLVKDETSKISVHFAEDGDFWASYHPSDDVRILKRCNSDASPSSPPGLLRQTFHDKPSST